MVLIERFQHHSGEPLEGRKNTLAIAGNSLEVGCIPGVERFFHFLDAVDIRQVSLVVLQDDRRVGDVEPMLLEVLLEVFQALDVFIHLATLGVCDEDDSICSLQHELASGVVIHLSGDGVDLEFRLHPCHLSQVEGEEVEEEGSVPLGGDAGEVADTGVGCLLVYYLEVRGLTTEPRAVVHDLAIDFFQREVDLYHVSLSMIVRIPDGQEIRISRIPLNRLARLRISKRPVFNSRPA